MSVLPFMIRLEGVASPMSSRDAAGKLLEISRRLGIGVIAVINDVEVFAFPEDEPLDVDRRWRRGFAARPREAAKP